MYVHMRGSRSSVSSWVDQCSFRCVRISHFSFKTLFVFNKTIYISYPWPMTIDLEAKLMGKCINHSNKKVTLVKIVKPTFLCCKR